MSFFRNYLVNPLQYLRGLNKFNLDFIWNIASFFLVGVVGISINILIIKYYDSSTLGVFNIVFALYTLLSQITTGGIHLSVQKHIPQYYNKKKKVNVILTSAILITFIISVTITLICFYFKDIPGKIFGNEEVNAGFLLSLPGLIFFSINKVELSFLIGARLMKSFAIFQALRFLLMLIVLLGLILMNSSGEKVSFILSGSEFILFLILNVYLVRYYKIIISKELYYWSKTHLIFGSKAMIGNMITDINTKVDVLILGFFTEVRIVGVYSFASSFAGGFNQLPYLLRNNINPILTKCYYKNGIKVLEKIIKKIKKNFYNIILILGIITILVYPLLVSLLSFKEDLSGSWIVFSILICGIIISGGYLPFHTIFNQLGFPGMQTFFLFAYFFTNLVLNFMLVPIWGMYGSAIATALAFIAQIFYIKILLMKKVNVKI